MTAYERHNQELSAQLALDFVRRRDHCRLSDLARDVYAVDFDDIDQLKAFRGIVDSLVGKGLLRVRLDPTMGVIAEATQV